VLGITIIARSYTIRCSKEESYYQIFHPQHSSRHGSWNFSLFLGKRQVLILSQMVILPKRKPIQRLYTHW